MVKKRTKRIQEVVDNVAVEAFGRKPEDAIRQRICVACGKKVEGMRDDLSIKEYLISGLCQECQDEIFG